MRCRQRVLVWRIALSLLPLSALTAQSSGRVMTVDDALAWRTAQSPVISNDGKWLAYALVQKWGGGEVVLQSTMGQVGGGVVLSSSSGTEERRFPGRATRVIFSDDSKWLAFDIGVPTDSARRLAELKRPAPSAIGLVDVGQGTLQRLEGVTRFEFSTAGGGTLVSFVPGEQHRPGTLHVRSLATGHDTAFASVSDFAVGRGGSAVAYTTLDTAATPHSALLLVDLATLAARTLEESSATITHPAWRGTDRLTVFRSDVSGADTAWTIVVFTDPGEQNGHRVAIRGADAAPGQPLGVLPDDSLRWTSDRQGLLFTLRPVRRLSGDPALRNAIGKSDVVIWHWKDEELPPQRADTSDRPVARVVEYRLDAGTYVPLAEGSHVRFFLPPRSTHWIFAADNSAGARMEWITGDLREDVYAVDVRTGARKLVLKNYLSSSSFVRRGPWFYPSPNGELVLYYKDKHYHVLNVATGQTRNLTLGMPVSFVDVEDTHPRASPPVDPTGWTRDGTAVLLNDRWDLWRVPVDGGKPVNLTGTGKRDGTKWTTLVPVTGAGGRGGRGGGEGGGGGRAGGAADAGVDVSRPLLVAPLSFHSKKSGLAWVDGVKGGVTMIQWGAPRFSQRPVLKARDANVYIAQRDGVDDPPNFYATDSTLKSLRQLSDINPQYKGFARSPGWKLLTYTGVQGRPLHAVLHLPAGYQPGQKYPTVFLIYEFRSDAGAAFSEPKLYSDSRALLTSRGYAVVEPDIDYVVNDPFISSTKCLLAALKEAVGTGVVDPKHVGITGWSFGGFQTMFVITQTDAFAAAYAGAGGSDMFSFFNSMYWRTGRPISSITEHDQIRFDAIFYGKNFASFMRNSAVFRAPQVHTPLVLIANDKDDAVDWHQGIEMFNALRRLDKPVIMLEYQGEGHGLTNNLADELDFATRMMEWFDHHLKGAPAAEWIVQGDARYQARKYP